MAHITNLSNGPWSHIFRLLDIKEIFAIHNTNKSLKSLIKNRGFATHFKRLDLLDTQMPDDILKTLLYTNDMCNACDKLTQNLINVVFRNNMEFKFCKQCKDKFCAQCRNCEMIRPKWFMSGLKHYVCSDDSSCGKNNQQFSNMPADYMKVYNEHGLAICGYNYKPSVIDIQYENTIPLNLTPIQEASFVLHIFKHGTKINFIELHNKIKDGYTHNAVKKWI